MTNQVALRRLFPAALALIAATPTEAAAQLLDGKQRCTNVNCGAQTINGSYLLDLSAPGGLPFGTAIFSAGGECVRVEVVKEASDLLIVLISPDGMFWRNDDSNAGGCPDCPLVKANTTVNGWYTLHISSVRDAAPGDFTAKYGRYYSGNPNCENPTTITGSQQRTAKTK